MPCDTWRRTPEQTLQQRIAEVRKAVSNLDALLRKRGVKVKVGPQGGIFFEGWTALDRAGVRDSCAYRRLMATGSALAKAEIARAEQIAGRSVDRKVLATGLHSHDGVNWSRH